MCNDFSIEVLTEGEDSWTAYLQGTLVLSGGEGQDFPSSSPDDEGIRFSPS